MWLQQVGTIHAAAFSDANLYAEVANKAFFWMQPSFYNIDITCLHKDAAAGYFTQVCTSTPASTNFCLCDRKQGIVHPNYACISAKLDYRTTLVTHMRCLVALHELVARVIGFAWGAPQNFKWGCFSVVGNRQVLEQKQNLKAEKPRQGYHLCVHGHCACPWRHWLMALFKCLQEDIDCYFQYVPTGCCGCNRPKRDCLTVCQQSARFRQRDRA